MSSAASSFFFNDTATTEIYTLSLHDALPILTYTDIAGDPVLYGKSAVQQECRDRKSGSAGMPRPTSYAVFCLKKKMQRARIFQFKQGGAILDIGCSSGGFLSTMNNGAWQLYGVEIEPSTAERARALSGAKVWVGDVLEAKFAPERFDVITCFDLLEHIYTPRQFRAQVGKWLKPGGIFYTVLPNIDSWEGRTFRTFWYGLELPRHLFHFSPRSLRYLFSL